MTTTTALPMNVLPAPRSNRQGDYIWTSTIYPIDTDGSVVHADALSPHVGESEMAAQTRAVCEGLKGTLAEAGTSMDRVLKAEVYLVDPAGVLPQRAAGADDGRGDGRTHHRGGPSQPLGRRAGGGLGRAEGDHSRR